MQPSTRPLHRTEGNLPIEGVNRQRSSGPALNLAQAQALAAQQQAQGGRYPIPSSSGGFPGGGGVHAPSMSSVGSEFSTSSYAAISSSTTAGGGGGYGPYVDPAAGVGFGFDTATSTSGLVTSSSAGAGAARPGVASWRSVADTVKAVVLSQVEDELTGRTYSAVTAQEAATTVAERCMLQLKELGYTTSFKVIIDATVLERIGAGLHSTSSAFWDRAHDGCTVVRFETQSMVCIVKAYLIAMV